MGFMEGIPRFGACKRSGSGHLCTEAPRLEPMLSAAGKPRGDFVQSLCLTVANLHPPSFLHGSGD